MPEAEQTRDTGRVSTYWSNRKEIGSEGKVLGVKAGLSTELLKSSVILRMRIKGTIT